MTFLINVNYLCVENEMSKSTSMEHGDFFMASACVIDPCMLTGAIRMLMFLHDCVASRET